MGRDTTMMGDDLVHDRMKARVIYMMWNGLFDGKMEVAMIACYAL
jgi:hypothetical protein